MLSARIISSFSKCVGEHMVQIWYSWPEGIGYKLRIIYLIQELGQKSQFIPSMKGQKTYF